jgi:DnaK suppressor protein
MAATKKKTKPIKKTPARKPEPKKKTVAKKPVAPAKKPAKPAAPLKKKSPPAATSKRAAAAKPAAKPVAKPIPVAPSRPSAAVAAKKVSAAAPAQRTANTGKPVSTPKASPSKVQTASLDEPRIRPAPYQAARDEEYMNANQVQHFRQLLMNWRHDLMQEVDRTVHHMQDDAANFPDPNDRATQEEEFALELRTRDRERKLIKKINESLAALDAGTYGYCETCGVEIGIKRLEARPTATLCIDCKTLDEIREKQRA